MLALRASECRCEDVKTIAERHLDAVRAKLQALRQMELSLTELVAICPVDASPGCPALEALDSRSVRSGSFSPSPKLS